MNKLFTSLVCLLFALQVFAQTSDVSQKTLVTKRTATWCPNCGKWGWDLAKAIDDLDNPNAILIRAHHSGDLESQVSKDITANFNAVYQPEFYLNEVRQSVGSSTWEEKVSDFDNIINENAENGPSVGIIVEAGMGENEIFAAGSVEFFNEIEGEVYLAAYLLESDVVNFQSQQGDDAVHNNVLRSSLTEGSFGSLVSEGQPTAGSLEEFSFSIEAEEGFEDRTFKILIVVWKLIDGQYKVENVNISPVSTLSSTNEIGKTESELVKVVQNSNSLYFELQNQNDAIRNIDLYTINGRLLGQFSHFKEKNQVWLEVPNLPGNSVIIGSIRLKSGHLINQKIYLSTLR